MMCVLGYVWVSSGVVSAAYQTHQIFTTECTHENGSEDLVWLWVSHAISAAFMTRETERTALPRADTRALEEWRAHNSLTTAASVPCERFALLLVRFGASAERVIAELGSVL
jgi:hypothetical protein